MRFNKKELAHYSSSSPTDFEGRLNYRTAGSSFAQPAFKERWFKLKSNLLFYYRFNDFGSVDGKEPAGVFVLENVAVQREEKAEMPFSFSLIFKDDPDYRHMFSARSEDLVTSWVKVIGQCSYEHLRHQLDTYQNMIKSMAGVESLSLNPFVNKQQTWSDQPQQPVPASRSPINRPKAESFKCHVPLFDKNASSLHSATPKNIFEPPPNATPVRPARSTDSSRNSPSGSPVRVPIRKPPPPPTTTKEPSKDLIEF